MHWFTDHGVELKVDITVVTEDALLCSKLLTMFLPFPCFLSCQTEDDGRVFPVTDNSASVVDCLLNEARKLGGNSLFCSYLHYYTQF
jgi:hypothetical protein